MKPKKKRRAKSYDFKCKISINDNGDGVTIAEVERVLKPFFQFVEVRIDGDYTYETQDA